jgi:hypothetical protein
VKAAGGGAVRRRRGFPAAPHGRLPVTVVALLIVVAVVASGLVVVLRGPGAGVDRDRVAVDEPVALAAAFVAGVVTSDHDRRARTVGALVVPERVPAFVEALDAALEPRAAQGARLAATPRAFKVVESSDTVRVVLVWTRVSRTSSGPVDGPDESWEVWGLGLMRTGSLWQVFSYEGTREGVPPGDPRLEGFSELV